MFIMKRTPCGSSGLDKVIDSLLNEMNSVMSDTEAYSKMVDQLVKLCTLRDNLRPKGVSNDTLAVIAGNLFGILIIVGFERANVVTSKALSFVLKLR